MVFVRKDRIFLIELGHPIILDIADFVDAPERHEQEQQAQHMQRRTGAENHRRQHPEGPVLQHDAVHKISLTGTLDGFGVAQGHVHLRQGAFVARFGPFHQ